ncbi:hypothetical protein N8813_03285 [bacterium]|nr:hypothetical protein [bacterium]
MSHLSLEMTASVPQFLLVALGLSVVAFFVLGCILLLQMPSIAKVVRNYTRLTWAKLKMKGQASIVDPAGQERTARSIEGGVLYFE